MATVGKAAKQQVGKGGMPRTAQLEYVGELFEMYQALPVLVIVMSVFVQRFALICSMLATAFDTKR